MNNDSICALATANGIGAIGIIRVSGNEALKIVSRVFDGKNLEKAKSHTVHYGFIVEKSQEPRAESQEPGAENQEPRAENQELRSESRDVGCGTQNHQPPTTNRQLNSTNRQPTSSQPIDEVMVAVFRAPRTFTTEDSVEISFHGSPFIAKKILEVLVKNGARIAKPGEFTMRAFLNGRIDLAQAESVADLIASENEASRKVALNQLKGGISSEISLLRNDLLNFTSLIELELDFAEEDVEFADRTALTKLISNLKSQISNLLESFKYGNALKNGTAVAIIGKPNAGKSTLLNALLKEERAIVSDIAGTTRDTIEEILHIKGHAFRLIDTAGLRETEDKIEAIGVEKAREKVATADVLIYLLDAATTDFSEDFAMLKPLLRDDLKVIICATKIDEVVPTFHEKMEEKLRAEVHHDFDFIAISAVENRNIQELKNELSSFVEQLKTAENSTVITSQRHFEALQKSLNSIKNVEDAIFGKISTELLAYELRSALEHLGEISGEFTNDEVLGNIFGKFCIGK